MPPNPNKSNIREYPLVNSLSGKQTYDISYFYLFLQEIYIVCLMECFKQSLSHQPMNVTMCN